MNKTNLNRLFFVFLCVSLPGVATGAHPYHVSLTEIEFNTRSGNFEVALCLWPADVERALSLQEQVPIDLDKASNLNDLLKNYIDKRFNVLVGEDRPTRIRWVGLETDNKRTWVYFELIAPDNSNVHEGIKIENRLFFELNDDQINQINFRVGKKSQSFSCYRGDWRIKIADVDLIH